jgi:hypothetical protein
MPGEGDALLLEPACLDGVVRDEPVLRSPRPLPGG